MCRATCDLLSTRGLPERGRSCSEEGVPFHFRCQRRSRRAPPFTAWRRASAAKLRVVSCGEYSRRMWCLASALRCGIAVRRAGSASANFESVNPRLDGDKPTFCVCGALTRERAAEEVKRVHV
jgi:hypothetical protein